MSVTVIIQIDRLQLLLSGPFVKRIATLLLAAIPLFPSRDIHALEQIPDQPARYHLIQIVDPEPFLEKVNNVAGQGYRLIALNAGSGRSLVAIMERVEGPSAHYNYLSIPVRGTKTKYETARKTEAEVAEQLNAAGARGYRLRMTFGASRTEMPNLAVMESNSDSSQSYEYTLTSPSAFRYFNKDEISGLPAAGYHWAAAVTMFLIFERAAVDSNGPPAGTTERSRAEIKPKVLATLRMRKFPIHCARTQSLSLRRRSTEEQALAAIV